RFSRDWSSDVCSSDLTLSMVNHMITRCTDGSERPDLIVTTPELWDRLWELFQAQQRYEAVQVADTGFDKIRFRGIDVIFDRYCRSEERRVGNGWRRRW